MRSGVVDSEAGKDIQFSSILSFGTLRRGSGAGLEAAVIGALGRYMSAEMLAGSGRVGAEA